MDQVGYFAVRLELRKRVIIMPLFFGYYQLFPLTRRMRGGRHVNFLMQAYRDHLECLREDRLLLLILEPPGL